MDVDRLLESARRLTIEEKEALVEELLDVLLSSVNLEMIPDDIGWRINEAYREGRLNKEKLLGELAYAVSIAEPAKFKKILAKLGVGE